MFIISSCGLFVSPQCVCGVHVRGVRVCVCVFVVCYHMLCDVPCAEVYVYDMYMCHNHETPTGICLPNPGPRGIDPWPLAVVAVARKKAKAE